MAQNPMSYSFQSISLVVRHNLTWPIDSPEVLLAITRQLLKTGRREERLFQHHCCLIPAKSLSQSPHSGMGERIGRVKAGEHVVVIKTV